MAGDPADMILQAVLLRNGNSLAVLTVRSIEERAD
jgi:hypothetical protein